MANVVIYSADWCPFCVRAKRLLEQKGVKYKEVNVDQHPGERQRIMTQTGMRTIPQIFINDEFIGGYTDLAAIDRTGELDKKLKA
ncbi:MAG: glutaredoxin 3 [Pseudobdellovibrionaceae bacterium]|nr:glutaredoxin 3 [Bdellovibrionales bacterium]USN47843.1 MAG: glutaredoxin 3 [Pseudobdellovibrionaceae bacterium]